MNAPRQWTPEELAAITEQTRAWAASEEGQRQMRESARAALKAIEEFDAWRHIAWWRLHEPMSR